MSTITLSNGQTLPQLGFGTWQVDPSDAPGAVYNAIKAGYRHIDCAEVYYNETEVGSGIKKAIDEGIVTRDDLWVTSKLWNDDHADVEAALNHSLKNLGLDYVNLYLIHWHTNWKKGKGPLELDPNCSIASTWKQMEQMVKAGKTRSIGVSNFTAAQVDAVVADCEIKPVMNQVESHPYWNQLQLQKDMDKHGIKITSYSAFSKNAGAVKDLFKEPVVVAIAEKHGKTVPQVLLRFHIELGRCVIPKSITEQRIKENFEANNFSLDEDDMDKLKNITPQHRSLNPIGFDGVANEPYFKD